MIADVQESQMPKPCIVDARFAHAFAVRLVPRRAMT
jgi:hypothetical protein